MSLDYMREEHWPITSLPRRIWRKVLILSIRRVSTQFVVLALRRKRHEGCGTLGGQSGKYTLVTKSLSAVSFMYMALTYRAHPSAASFNDTIAVKMRIM